MKAIAYVRVSTVEQAKEGVSLDAQEERIRTYCALHNLDLTAIVRDEGVSGGIPLAKRPGGQELLTAIRKHNVRNVVAVKLDRLFRDAADCLNQTREWDRHGIALHIIDMGGQSINTGSAMGRMFLTMVAGFAELERNLISERTAQALAHKKTRLEVYGEVPYGFRRVGDELVDDEDELRIIAQIKAWREKGWSFHRIAQELNARGIPTKKGRSKWHPSTVRNIVANDLYVA